MPVTEAPIKTDGRRKYAVAGNGFNQAEIDLLTYLAKGYDIPEAARFMGISKYTLCDYRKRVLKKLDACTQAEAVYQAVKRGIIQ